jgi:hypothetical protein
MNPENKKPPASREFRIKIDYSAINSQTTKNQRHKQCDNKAYTVVINLA